MYHNWECNADRTKFMVIEHVERRIPAGLYNIGLNMKERAVLARTAQRADALCAMAKGPLDMVMKSFSKFLGTSNHKIYAKMGKTHKRGYLLWGPHGTGKTCIVSQLVNYAITQDALCLIINGNSIRDIDTVLPQLREVEPERKVVMVIEDIDEIIRGYGDQILTELMDGLTTNGTGSTAFITTTNFIKNISARIKHRPSRIDEIYFVGFASAEQRREYLTAYVEKFREDAHEMPHVNFSTFAQEAVALTDKYTLAQLNEFMLLHFARELPLAECARRLKHFAIAGDSDDGYGDDDEQDDVLPVTANDMPLASQLQITTDGEIKDVDEKPVDPVDGCMARLAHPASQPYHVPGQMTFDDPVTAEEVGAGVPAGMYADEPPFRKES